jgi:hypothetical protein
LQGAPTIRRDREVSVTEKPKGRGRPSRVGGGRGESLSSWVAPWVQAWYSEEAARRGVSPTALSGEALEEFALKNGAKPPPEVIARYQEEQARLEAKLAQLKEITKK